ncbi:MAG: SAM-dependent chlorinase/fluorinase [Bacteroidales bacterium]|nr:SAM-dependent chlorinase/fluorinase [Bacteroidales bacterium]
MNQIISLTSDWGESSHYIAMFKALILSKAPHARIVDISHNVSTFNLEIGAYILSSTYHFFPEKSVHVFNVDSYNNDQSSRYSMARRNNTVDSLPFVDYLAVKYKNHYFLALNNGFFSLLCDDFNHIEEVVKLPKCDDYNHIKTFDAIPFLLQAAVDLSENVSISKIGTPYPIENIETIKIKTPLVKYTEEKGDVIVFHIKHIDSYGNIITNLHKDVFEKVAKDRKKIRLYIHELGDEMKFQIVDSYSDVAKYTSPIVFFNIAGYMEISFKFSKLANYLAIDMFDIYEQKITLYFEENKKNIKS